MRLTPATNRICTRLEISPEQLNVSQHAFQQVAHDMLAPFCCRCLLQDQRCVFQCIVKTESNSAFFVIDLSLINHQGPGGSMSQVVGLPNNSYKPITNTAWVRAQLGKLQKKGALDSQPQVIKFTSCLPMVGGSLWVLRLLPPLKLVAMIQLKY